jgi:dynein assembly factor 1
MVEVEPSVMVINLENNKISGESVLDEIFVKIPLVRVIDLQGNDCLRKIPSYRKNFIVKLKELRYLDDRPVFDDERRFAEAFAEGGLEQERKERALYKKEKEEEDLKRIRDFQDMVTTWKGDDEERQKRKEEERQKLLDKCKGKLKKEAKKENQIFADEDLVNKEEIEKNASNANFQSEVDNIKNAHFDELPSLETAKNLKESGYVEYMLEQSGSQTQVIDKLKDGTSKSNENNQITIKDEIINTSCEKNNTNFEELD